jgi:hypothetical protein
MDGLAACFAGFDDPLAATPNGYDLLETLKIALCALLSGRERTRINQKVH